MLIELIYQSYASHQLSEAELNDLVSSAQEKNRQLAITGCLVHVDGEYAQILEGKEEEVLDLYQTIKNDGRHHGVFLIYQGPIQKRSFNNWTMGLTHYEDIEALNNDPDLSFRSIESLATISNDASFARKMFAQFSLKAIKTA